MQEVVNSSNLQDNNGPEMEKSTFYHSAPVLVEIVENVLLNALRVGCNAVEKGLKTALTRLVKEVIMYITQQKERIHC